MIAFFYDTEGYITVFNVNTSLFSPFLVLLYYKFLHCSPSFSYCLYITCTISFYLVTNIIMLKDAFHPFLDEKRLR